MLSNIRMSCKTLKVSKNYSTCSIKSVVLCSLCKCVDALLFSFPSIFFKPVPVLFFSLVGELSLEGDAISAIRLCWKDIGCNVLIQICQMNTLFDVLKK